LTCIRWVELHPRGAVVPGAPPPCLSRRTRFTQVCKAWRRELEAWGFCGKTAHLCAALARGEDAARLRQNALRRLNASSGVDAERALCLDGGAFPDKSEGWTGSVQASLQAARGLYSRTAKLCSTLAGGGDAERLQQNARRRLNASTDVDAARAMCLDGGAFLEKSAGRKGNLQEWLQAASQEPDASFLSRGAASTAQSLGLALVRWAGKPQGRYPGSYTLPGHSDIVHTVALSRDGRRAASGSWDTFVKIWNTETGAEVSSLEWMRSG